MRPSCRPTSASSILPKATTRNWRRFTISLRRYLLITCSRPGGQPANLQGLWNESMNPPWGGKYTININTEMNYWPAEIRQPRRMRRAAHRHGQ